MITCASNDDLSRIHMSGN